MNQIRAAEQILQMKQDEQHNSLLQILQQIQQSGQQAIATMQNCIPSLAPTSMLPLNLNLLLHEVLLLSDVRIQSYAIEVDWRPQQQLPSVLGSENKLRILFKQLIDNAIDAMLKQGTYPMRLTIATACDEEWIYACVADSGPGIAPDKRSKVFEPFYTTRQDSHQAGMGLVMVKEIIDQHQGLIEIDNQYKQGCRFKISFPYFKN
jgi:nitrogen fixation negative regulator NifL